MGLLERMLGNLMGGKSGGHHGGSRHGGHGGYSGYPPDTDQRGGKRDISCPKCGDANANTARFCQKCGGSLSTGKCSSCNTELAAGAKFCGQCGKPQP
mgnify:CR=1 FL=1